MKRDEQDRLFRAIGQRNDADIRMVQGLVGALVGGGVGVMLDMQLLRAYHWPAEPPVWLLVLVPLLASTAGACLGYFQDTWRSGL